MMTHEERMELIRRPIPIRTITAQKSHGGCDRFPNEEGIWGRGRGGRYRWSGLGGGSGLPDMNWRND